MTKPGASARAELLGGLDRLVDRHLGGHVGPVQQLVQRHAQDVALERRDPVERPALRVALDQRVELGAGRARTPSTSSRVKGLRVAVEQLLGRPAGHVRLVERHDRGPALVGAAHRRLRPRDVLAGAGVHAHAVTHVHEQRHPHHRRRTRAWPACRRRRRRCRPRTPGSVSVTASSTALGTWMSWGASST